MIYEFVIYKNAGYTGSTRTVVGHDDIFEHIDEHCGDVDEAFSEMLETGSYEFTSMNDNYVYIVAIEPVKVGS